MTPAAGLRPRRWSPWPRSRPDRLLTALLVVTLAPAVVVMARVAVLDWEPSGDQAIIVLRMHDTFSAHPPLRGPWSRFGWDHPGPLLFWMGAPALALAGPSGVLVHLTAISTASVVATTVAARRLAGTGYAALVTVATAVLIHSHGPIRLADPWNPWATVLPLLCFVFTVALAASTGARWATAVAVLTGSYAAQTHLGNAPVVLAATVAGIIWWAWTRRGAAAPPTPTPGADADAGTAGRSGTRRFPVVVAAFGALGVALWSGPIVDQLANDPGNLRALVEFAGDSPDEAEALSVSLGAAARELGFVPAWLGADEGVWPIDPAPVWTLLVLPLALGAGLLAPARRLAGSRPGRVELAAFAGATYLAAVTTVTRTTGGLIFYVLRWSWPVALLATTVALLPLVDVLGRNDPRVWRILRAGAAGVAMVVTVAASTASTITALSDPVTPMASSDSTTRELSRAIREVLPPGSYAFRHFDARVFSAVGTGTAASLARHGYQIDVPETRFGEFRSQGRTDLPYLVVIGKSLRHAWTPPPGAHRLVHWDHLTPAERTRADVIESRVRSDAGMDVDQRITVDSPEARSSLVADGADPSDVAELHHLESDRDWYEAWLLPAGTPP